MKLRRPKYLVETPTSAMNDIAFILIVFFLVCASVQQEDGRPQEIPNADKKLQLEKPIRVGLERDHIKLNGEVMAMKKFEKKLSQLLSKKINETEKTVAVRCGPTVPYYRWMDVTGTIEDAGGTITLMRKVQ